MRDHIFSLEVISYTILWVVWCCSHSILAANFMKRLFERFARVYRLAFNGFALVTFFMMVLYERSLPRVMIYQFEGLTNIVRVAVFVAGVAIFIITAFHYNLLHFAGISQLFKKVDIKAANFENRFVITGPLRVVRHPWYSAAHLVIWTGSKELYITTLTANLVFSIYLIIGSVLEERKLVEQYGESYRHYQKQVSMLVPVRWIKTLLLKKEKTEDDAWKENITRKD